MGKSGRTPRSQYLWADVWANNRPMCEDPNVVNWAKGQVNELLEEVVQLRQQNTTPAYDRYVKALRATITSMQENITRKNRELDALHLVWCSGPCSHGIHRWFDERPTAAELEELVKIGEQNLRRLKSRLGVARHQEGL